MELKSVCVFAVLCWRSSITRQTNEQQQQQTTTTAKLRFNLEFESGVRAPFLFVSVFGTHRVTVAHNIANAPIHQ